MGKAPDGNGQQARQPPAEGAAKAAGLKPRDLRQARFALSFSQIIAVLMRDPGFRNLRLADLEWLVLPPVMSGQFRLAQAPAMTADRKGAAATGKEPEGGVLVPVAVALWARVSANTDKMLSQNLDKPVKLHPGDWSSGDNIWLMAVAGDRRAVPRFLQELRAKEFKDRPVKMRMRSKEGKVTVKTLSQN